MALALALAGRAAPNRQVQDPGMVSVMGGPAVPMPVWHVQMPVPWHSGLLLHAVQFHLASGQAAGMTGARPQIASRVDGHSAEMAAGPTAIRRPLFGWPGGRRYHCFAARLGAVGRGGATV